MFGFNHFPFTHGEELEKARAEHKEAFKNEMRAMRTLKEAQAALERGESVDEYSNIEPDIVSSVKDNDSGIANPLVKSQHSAQKVKAREGLGGYKN